MVKYNEVELEVIKFATEDVITNSCTAFESGCTGDE